MIEGIHCDLPTSEMRALLDGQIEHHKAKIEFYAKTATDLAANGMTHENGTRNPLGDIENKAKEHQQASDLFTFIREHLVPGETYRLSESDMSRLGFIKGRY